MTNEEKILRAADEAFLENGFDGTTTDMIAAASGLTHAMVHYYYKSKSSLFKKVIGIHLDAIMEEAVPVFAMPGNIIQRIINTALTIYDALGRDMRFPLLFFSTSNSNPEMVTQYYTILADICSKYYELQLQVIEASIVDGSMSLITPQELTHLILDLCCFPYIFASMMSSVDEDSHQKIRDYLIERRNEMAVILRCRLTPQ